jgi:hypothetical protein
VRVHEEKQHHWLPARQLGDEEMYSCKQTFIPHTLLCMEVRITGFQTEIDETLSNTNKTSTKLYEVFFYFYSKTTEDNIKQDICQIKIKN